MQEHFRLTLFIIGICIIGGILLHGIWSIRQNSKKSKRNSFESRNWEPEFEHEDDLETQAPIFDDVGVSKARVLVNPSNKNHEESANSESKQILNSSIDVGDNLHAIDDEAILSEPFVSADIELEGLSKQASLPQTPSFTDAKQADDECSSKSDEANDVTLNEGLHAETLRDEELNEEDVDSEHAPVYSNVVTQPKPEFNKPNVSNRENHDADFGQPPGFLLKQNEEDIAITHSQPSNNTSEVENPSMHNPTSDFSLNIQEGPLLSNENKDSPHLRSVESNSVPSSPAVDSSQEKPGVEKELSFAEQAKRFVRRNKKTVADKIRKEPVLKAGAGDDQMRIDFDTSVATEDEVKLKSDKTEHGVSAQDEHSKNTSQEDTSASKESASTATDVLVLNVRANNDSPIEGAALLPMLLTLGFKFGEHDIFHRHVNTNGKGPILFSLTNMFKPGVFDIDNIENFSTLGISLFMMLPIEGDAQQVFNMMHNAARKLSDEFDCRILDGNKVGLSKQSLQQYIERIREFERKRLNR